MSHSLQQLFDDWKHSDAPLLSTSTNAGAYDRVDIKRAVEKALEIYRQKNPTGDGYVIPLFRTDEPVPINEYVLYNPDTGQLSWFDSEFGVSGMKRFTAVENLAETSIAARLRWWLPEYHDSVEVDIDESVLPPEAIQPVDSLSKDEQEAFFADLREFVRSEMEAQRESNWEAYDEMGLENAIRRGQVAGPFIPLGEDTSRDGNRVYRFQLAEDEDTDEEQSPDLRDDESLFNDDICVVDTPQTDDGFPLEVELERVNDVTLSLRPRWDTTNQQGIVESQLVQDGTDIFLYKLLNPVPFERRLSAIRAVAQDPDKRGLLTGNRPASFTVNKFNVPESALELNEYQYEALVWADGADDFMLIHGPPGTGKTRTLTAYIRHAVDRGKSVLVTAHSNQAVDNLIVGDSTVDEIEDDTLHAMAQDDDVDLSIARVGNNSHNRVVTQHYSNVAASGADVVGATTSGASRFDTDEFDVAVVDEATQASRPATAIALNCAQKIILAGDHKQLPPFSANDEMQDEEMHISLFEYLLERYGEEITVLLRRQYRMHENIAEFPSQRFYGGQIETADQNQDWQIADLQPLMGVDIAGTEKKRSGSRSYYNDDEAEAVARQVELLVRNGLDPADIGVISAYSGQISRIKNEVRSLDIANPRRVTVDTVDSFQGGEREAIIVSFVRSNEEGHSGFLEVPDEGPRRLNVALTRARKRLVLVGNWETLGTIAPHRREATSCAPLYSALATHIRSNGWMLE